MIPFWRKFLIRFWRCEGGATLQILFGLVAVSFLFRYFYEWSPYERLTGIGVGFIPWKIKEGGVFPYRQLVYREPVMQKVWTRGL